MFLKGVSVKNFRSIGKTGIDVHGLEKINILIGKNNAGKSNILKFIDFLSRNDIRSGNVISPFGEYDYHGFDVNNVCEFELIFDIPEESDLFQFSGETTFSQSFRIDGSGQSSEFNLFNSTVHRSDMQKIREFVENNYGISGGNDSDRLTDLITRMALDRRFSKPPIIYLNEFRTLDKNENLENAIDELINHDSREQKLKKPIVETLTTFISTIIGRQVTIRFPRSKKIELILDGGDSMQLTSLGTGLHEIVLMAFYLASSAPAIICLDEPELHLHPETQRAFLRFISENTVHQYFIATHSNNFLDPDIKSSIYHIFTSTDDNDVQTIVEKCDNLQSKRELLQDLGIRASEILQTNGIIWVEGPSDRNYINAWLNVVDPGIKEGFDFTYQYYGGAILSGFAIGDHDFNDFIDMLFINRNSFVIMDSDMDSSYKESELQNRKKKIIKGCKYEGLGYWVTAGREIENYLSENLLEKAYSEKINVKPFNKIESYCSKFDKYHKSTESKKIAHHITLEDLKDNLDLEVKIKSLLKEIYRWKSDSKVDKAL